MKQVDEAKQASRLLATAGAEVKNAALQAIAVALEENKGRILAANRADRERAEKEDLAATALKRLDVDESKVEEMKAGVMSVMALPDPVGKVLSETELDDGLVLSKVSCPLGVIGVIFESRPDALVQISALCLKAGNAVVLKGGREADETNTMLFTLIREATEKAGVPKGWIQLLHSREDVAVLLQQDDAIDLIIPRGTNTLVQYVQQHTKIPVLGHASGVCHVYVDSDADLEMAARIVHDAKCQYPAVCNAMETLLVHESIAARFLPLVAKQLQGVELRGDERTKKHIAVKDATEEDWRTEYNDLILSISVVADVQAAIEHINRHGSRHTDAIVTRNGKTAEKFMNEVDAASVIWNASTRFADGFRYGLGAEVGIATGKLHARGPVGLEGLLSYKYKVRGSGQIVAEYVGPTAKAFRHRRNT